MKKYGGYIGKILDIDLKSRTYHYTCLRKKGLYLGGKIMGPIMLMRCPTSGL